MSLTYALAAAMNGPTEAPAPRCRTGSNAPSLASVDPGPKDSHSHERWPAGRHGTLSGKEFDL
jgi:hypothetical protein